MVVTDVDLSRCRIGKDLGKGFYLSDDKYQAMKMSMLVTRREGEGEPTLNTFLFDETVLSSNILNFMRFDSYSAEWAEFVLMNRYSFCATDIPVLLWHGTFFIIFKK